MRLEPCPSCACHVFADACSCPHCGVKLRTCSHPLARAAGAALVGVALATGCSADGKDTDTGELPVEPLYGVTVTDADTDADSDTDTDTDTDADSDTDTDTDTDTDADTGTLDTGTEPGDDTAVAVEPLYGVVDTGEPGDEPKDTAPPADTGAPIDSGEPPVEPLYGVVVTE